MRFPIPVLVGSTTGLTHQSVNKNDHYPIWLVGPVGALLLRIPYVSRNVMVLVLHEGRHKSQKLRLSLGSVNLWA